MQVNSVDIFKGENYSRSNKNFSKRKKIIILSGGAILASSMLLLANYNRPRVVKDSVLKPLKMCKDKFLDFCSSVNVENYVASEANVRNKVFSVDLHSHSNHSDGWGNVSDILNQVAKYADELFEKTGKKFTFALTDHDRVSGVREANKIIKSDPEKYTNINFIPAVELSFSFVSRGKVKSGELLAYFVNPESCAMKLLVDDLNSNRLKMINDCIKKLGCGFSREELNDYFLNKDGETFAYNLHYRLSNYAQIKNRVNKIALERNENSEILYEKLMRGYVFGVNRVPKPFVSPEGFDNYLKSIGLFTDTKVIDENISRICDNYFPKIINGRVVSKTENSFEKIINILKYDNEVVLGFAHPYFTAKQMVDFKKEFSALLEYAKGKIRLSENYHQAYSSNINKNEIEEINNFLLSKGLIPVGGRDNHSSRFI